MTNHPDRWGPRSPVHDVWRNSAVIFSGFRKIALMPCGIVCTCLHHLHLLDLLKEMLWWHHDIMIAAPTVQHSSRPRRSRRCSHTSSTPRIRCVVVTCKAFEAPGPKPCWRPQNRRHDLETSSLIQILARFFQVYSLTREITKSSENDSTTFPNLPLKNWTETQTCGQRHCKFQSQEHIPLLTPLV